MPGGAEGSGHERRREPLAGRDHGVARAGRGLAEERDAVEQLGQLGEARVERGLERGAVPRAREGVGGGLVPLADGGDGGSVAGPCEGGVERVEEVVGRAAEGGDDDEHTARGRLRGDEVDDAADPLGRGDRRAAELGDVGGERHGHESKTPALRRGGGRSE